MVPAFLMSDQWEDSGSLRVKYGVFLDQSIGGLLKTLESNTRLLSFDCVVATSKGLLVLLFGAYYIDVSSSSIEIH